MEFRRRMMWSRCSDGRRLTEGTHSTETAIDLLSCGIRNTGWQMEGCHSNNHGWLIFGFCLCCRECSGSGDWPDDTLTDIPTRHSPTFADTLRHKMYVWNVNINQQARFNHKIGGRVGSEIAVINFITPWFDVIKWSKRNFVFTLTTAEYNSVEIASSAFTNTFTHSLTRSLTPSLTHSLTHSLGRSVDDGGRRCMTSSIAAAYNKI